jgi:hypothetical protein
MVSNKMNKDCLMPKVQLTLFRNSKRLDGLFSEREKICYLAKLLACNKIERNIASLKA